MNKQPAGLLDTNVLIHALTTDAQGEDCRRFIAEIRAGTRTVLLTSLVAFEFTYAVSRYARQMTREDIGDYLVSVMSLSGVELEDDLLFDAVLLWSRTPGLGFVDAYLGLRAKRDGAAVFTKNVKHFERFDIDIPDPLASYIP